MSATAVSALADLSVSETRRALVLLTRANLIEAASGDAQRWRMDGMIRRHAQQAPQPTVMSTGASKPWTDCSITT